MVTIPALTMMGVRLRVPVYLARLPSLHLLVVSPSRTTVSVVPIKTPPSRTAVSVAPGVTRAEVVEG